MLAVASRLLTSEEMVFQAALGHELVHQEQLPVLAAVAQQPHQVGMRQSAQEVDLRLHLPTQGITQICTRQRRHWHADELTSDQRGGGRTAGTNMDNIYEG